MLMDFQNTIGRASDVIPNVDSNFEQACLWIMTEAFKQMKREKRYDLTWKETCFSACLVGCMQKIRHEKDIRLRIDPESHLYRKEMLNCTEDPDTAPRIDIKISGGWVREDVYYGIEGKVLVENNWRTRNASYLRRRYITTGIDNFVNGRYSDKMDIGCMVGYVVQGSASEIASKINTSLIRDGRNKENIILHVIDGSSDCYLSKHMRTTDHKEIELRHVFLTFV
ncbi:MAG: hypothetical protein MIO93_02535 [ANME-2 cluster archaeon]|jgi:hypothetical protein|nr:hypothetical protein [ANME-2 cluster archaeon]